MFTKKMMSFWPFTRRKEIEIIPKKETDLRKGGEFDACFFHNNKWLPYNNEYENIYQKIQKKKFPHYGEIHFNVLTLNTDLKDVNEYAFYKRIPKIENMLKTYMSKSEYGTILCLQEICHEAREIFLNSSFVQDNFFVVHPLPWTHDDFGDDKRGYGNMILSQFPIEIAKTIGFGGLQGRALNIANVKINNTKNVGIATVHLDSEAKNTYFRNYEIILMKDRLKEMKTHNNFKNIEDNWTQPEIGF